MYSHWFKVIEKQHLHCAVLTSVLGINTLSTVEAAPVFFPSSYSELLLIRNKCITEHTFHVVVFLWAALFTLNSWWHWINLCDWTKPAVLDNRQRKQLRAEEQEGGDTNSLILGNQASFSNKVGMLLNTKREFSLSVIPVETTEHWSCCKGDSLCITAGGAKGVTKRVFRVMWSTSSKSNVKSRNSRSTGLDVDTKVERGK